MKRATCWSLAATVLVAGCVQTADEAGAPVGDAPDQKAQVAAGKADHWTSADDPKLFSGELEYRLAELPAQGEAANIPWAANYWPVYQDSINYAWGGAGTEAPSTKYGRAFGVAGVEDAVSSQHGIDHYSSRTACTKDSECNADIGEKCAMRDGAEGGFCIPTWWGICHAWAPLAILQPEPVHPVTVGDVTFQVNDIKALLTLVYNRTTSKFVSLRCNEDDSTGEIEYDGYGRPTGSDAECKDTNPGTLHVLLSNYLGLKGESFVMDRTFDDEVWNQPLRGYRFTLEEVDSQRANQLVGVLPEGEGAVETFDGDVAKGKWAHQTAVAVEAGKQVVVTMSGTGDADLYVRFGSEPTSSAYDCRPWSGGSDETCELTVPEGESKLFVSVNGYADESTFELKIVLDPLAGLPTEYQFNPKAVSFYHVHAEVDFIAESAASQDGNLASTIDRYTHTDRLEYVLEVDKDGKIHGGEWVGASKKAHPDFLWLPTGRSNVPVAGGKISYEQVKLLLDRSLAGPGASAEIVTLREQGSVAKGAWQHFGPFTAGEGDLTAVISGTGDGDLYVRKGAAPTANEYDCRPYKGGSNESCALSGAGEYFVAVYGYTAAEFEVAVTYVAAGEQPDAPGEPEEPVEVVHLNLSSTVALDELKVFTLEAKAGRRVVVRTEAAADVDIYAKMNLAPTTYNYDVRAYTESGNESVTIVPSADGVLYIAVHGYEASDFTLTTANE